MAEQTDIPRPDVPAPDAALPEDSGRLVGAPTWRLAAIIVSMVLLAEILPLQQLMVSVILPKVGASFPHAGAAVTWSVTILGILGGATMALVGKLADLVGKKKILAATALLFLVSALICALTHNWALFLVGRGLGGIVWGMSAVEYGLVRDLFPRHWIPICVGVIGTGFGVSSIVGPVIEGALTDSYSWRSVFWFLFIYTLVTLPLFWFVVPETPVRAKQRLDLVGALLFGAGVAAVLIYVSQGTSWGWGTGSCLAYLIGGLIALAAFLVWESRTPEPMMELRLLRAPQVLFVMVIALLVTSVLSVISIMQSYMFETPKASVLKQQIVGGIAAQAHAPAASIAPLVHFSGDVGYGAGFSLMQLALHISLFSSGSALIFGPLGGWLCRRYGSRLPMLIGTVALLVAGAVWAAWHTTWPAQAAIGIPFGLAFGFYYAAAPNLLMDVVPAHRQGISAGMLAVFGGIGTSVSTALFTAIASAHPFKAIIASPTGGKPVTQVIPQVYANSGYTLGYILLAVVPAAICVVLTLILRSGRTPARGGEGVVAPV